MPSLECVLCLGSHSLSVVGRVSCVCSCSLLVLSSRSSFARSDKMTDRTDRPTTGQLS